VADDGGTERIAVVLATVHRPADLVRALTCVLQSAYRDYEVVIVDQGGDPETIAGVARFTQDPRVRYTRMARLGLSAALNHAARLTDANLIAITGDDCTMRPDWLDALVPEFADPRVAALFGSVASAPCDAARGFVPGCRIDAPFTARALEELHRMSGTTACMAIRRRAWNELGGFDEALGVGAPLRSAEDLDFALRALHAGMLVVQTPAVEVTHHSPVAWQERGSVVRRNWYGSGAVIAKWLKLAPPPMVRALVSLVGRWMGGGSGVAATYGTRPARGAMLAGFATGFTVGLAWPVDRRRRLFRRWNLVSRSSERGVSRPSPHP
jgi:glycosyl transferase family 2